MSAPLELLILDVNGVLYRYDVERRIARLGELLDRSPAAVTAAVFDSGIEAAADAGELSPDEYLARVGSELRTSMDRDAWRTSLIAAVEPNEPVLDLLAGVGDQVAMITLSNNGLLVKEEVDLVFPRLGDIGIEFHVAAELGAAKPDRSVYLDACELRGVAPEAAAFVDDKQKNVDGALRAGIAAHRFSDTAGLRGFLEACGLDMPSL
jgi:FMN phosphatase YigB (HAD superfamily)